MTTLSGVAEDQQETGGIIANGAPWPRVQMISRDQVGAIIWSSRHRPVLIPDDRELPEAYPDAEMWCCPNLPASVLVSMTECPNFPLSTPAIDFLYVKAPIAANLEGRQFMSLQ